MMALVENFADTGPMRIGVGLEEDTVALFAAAADHVIAPSETKILRRMRAFRVEDTIVIVRPTLLRVQSYQELIESSEGEGHFEVVGHEAVRLTDRKSIDDFRAVKAIVGKSAPVSEARGRRPDIVYSLEQAETFMRLWYEVPRRLPAEVNDRIEAILELPQGTISNQWIKDLCVKYAGTARRTPPEGWDGIQVDSEGKNVKYWEASE